MRIRIVHLFTSMGIAAWVATAHGTPMLAVESAAIDAELVEGYEISHAFLLHNRGDEPLRIRGVEAECAACTSVSLASPVIPPGTSTTLVVRIDLSEIEGPFSKGVTVLSDSAAGPVALSIAGTALHPYRFSPPTLNLAPATGDTAATVTAHVVRSRDDLSELLRAECDSDLFSARLSRSGTAGEYLLTVASKPPLPDGHSEAVIELVPRTPTDPKVTIRASAFVRPRVDIRPAALRLAPLDEPQKRILFIRQNASQNLSLLDARAPFDTITCELYAEPRQPHYRVYITAHSLADLDGKRGNLVLTFQKQGMSSDPEAVFQIAVPLTITGAIGSDLPGIDRIGAAECEVDQP
ncbi:MAG: DUF1573 domain-containing protein [Verrucomicrobia bacterium]|nr:DUF1573 domain-containing protein [Verrucomicrobiota bacterium]